MKLSKYRRKRDFSRTPEPRGERTDGPGRARRFVVQKHRARRLHYDFRLELDGVLKSWAVPKGPSLDPRERRLAVHVEDHPIEYGSFEGIIPEGEYGGGSVMLWDRGVWEPDGDPGKGYAAGRLRFRLDGEKLHGSWTLVRMQGRARDGGKDWLLIKRRDREARGAGTDVLAASPDSVASGRTMDEIAAAREASRDPSDGGKRRSRRSPTGKSRGAKPPRLADVARLEGARRARQPARLAPQLATLMKQAPAGDDWLHEIKHDGYRLLAFIEDGDVRLRTRAGHDWSDRFPELVDHLGRLPIGRAVLDGEVVALRPDGTASFQLLQGAASGQGGAALACYLFDLPFCSGYDLRRTPLVERKRLLERILDSGAAGTPLRYSSHVRGHGPEVLRNGCRMAIEGLVSKRADAPYVSARTRSWVKVKCLARQEFLVVGYTSPSGSRHGFGALALGVHDDAGRIVYCGKVGTGFDADTLAALAARLRRLAIDTPAVERPPRGREGRGIHWVRPELVVEVAFTEWTSDGALRHPSFEGVREDRAPQEVRREVPLEERENAAAQRKPAARARARPPRPRRTAARGAGRTAKGRARSAVTVAGITLTHPDRIMYPERGVTKLGLAQYVEQVAGRMLPHVARRPLAVVRCPQGRQSQCFFQKHLGEGWPEPVYAIDVEEKRGAVVPYIAIRDLAGLVALVQHGVLEVHPWGSREDRIERPDRIVFDLDPGPGVPWRAVVDAARLLRGVLADLGLAAFVRTTGGKGLHVVSPIVRRLEWADVKSFTRDVADHVRARHPDRFVTNIRKNLRRGRILVDYLRNGRGATAIASYSPRARAGAPVAANLDWDELDATPSGSVWNVENLRGRLAVLERDPWEGFARAARAITRSAWKGLRR